MTLLLKVLGTMIKMGLVIMGVIFILGLAIGLLIGV